MGVMVKVGGEETKTDEKSEVRVVDSSKKGWLVVVVVGVVVLVGLGVYLVEMRSVGSGVDEEQVGEVTDEQVVEQIQELVAPEEEEYTNPFVETATAEAEYQNPFESDASSGDSENYQNPFGGL